MMPSKKILLSCTRTQSGLGLVELMISITLSLVIMSGVIQLFVSSSQTSYNAQASSRIQENMRYAIKRISDDIAKAGDLGCFSHSTAPANYLQNRLDSVVLNTVNRGSWNDFATAFVSGDNDDSTNDAAVLDGTDTLVIKYIDAASATQVTALPNNTSITLASGNNLTNGQLAVVGNCESAYVINIGVIDNDSDGNDDDGIVTVTNTSPNHELSLNNSPAFLYSGNTGSHRYYIGTAAGEAANSCGSTAAARLNCSLYRQTNGGAAQEIVRGVHNMQVSYVQGGSAVFTNDPSAIYDTVDRIQVILSFNSAETAGQLIDRNITRVFGMRNQLLPDP